MERTGSRGRRVGSREQKRREQEGLQHVVLRTFSVMAFEKIKNILRKRPKDLPGDLWETCKQCSKMVLRKQLEERFRTCPECGFLFPLSWEDRVRQILDPGSFQELWGTLESCDPLKFQGPGSYLEKLEKARKETGLRDGCVVGEGTLDGCRVMFGVTDSRFLMGSMGSVLGEKITRSFEHAREKGLPMILVSGSGGGARMYEGCLSLMQMAKTSAAISRFKRAGGLFISMLTNPTMAGVLASFASLGDIHVAEPRALIGFTGPRVIEQTIKQELPKGFQTSEFLLEHGFLDRIIERSNVKKELSTLLHYLT